MAFNGYSTDFNNLNFHNPLPSFSSEAYRQELVRFYRQVATNFRGKSIFGYYLWQEPGYSQLRENQHVVSGWTGTTEAGDARWYEVDYSLAELNRYNSWRSQKGMGVVSRIPFPVDSTYDQFRKENQAALLGLLAQAVKLGDPNARIHLSLYGDLGLGGMATDFPLMLQQTQPLVTGLEWPDFAKYMFENPTRRTNFIQTLRNNSPSKEFVSYYKESPALSKDQPVADSFGNLGFTDYYAPAMLNSLSLDGNGETDGKYPLWQKNCSTCFYRYKSPAQSQLLGRVVVDANRNGIFDEAEQWSVQTPGRSCGSNYYNWSGPISVNFSGMQSGSIAVNTVNNSQTGCSPAPYYSISGLKAGTYTVSVSGLNGWTIKSVSAGKCSLNNATQVSNCTLSDGDNHSWFLIIPPSTPTATPLPLPIDPDGDGNLDFLDLVKIKNSFGSTYSIYSYKKMAKDFGRSVN